MVQRFYLHDATTDIVGTLPGATSLQEDFGGTPPTYAATNAETNRVMDGTIGAGQTSASVTTSGSGTQSGWFRRFLTPPLAATTYDNAQSMSLSMAGSESNANSDFFIGWRTYQWRPSTGSSIAAKGVMSSIGLEVGTSQTVRTGTGVNAGPSDWTILDGDVIVLEMFRFANTQGMANSYTNTFFYDGTTEGSTTDIAAYIDFGVDLALYTPPSADNVPPSRMRPYLSPIAQ